MWAVGDGQVRSAGWNGGCGKAVILRHRNGYETVYCHLSGLAVSAGKPVSQKQAHRLGGGGPGSRRARTCTTAVKRGGAFVNPLQLKVPRGTGRSRPWMDDFRGRGSRRSRARFEGELARL